MQIETHWLRWQDEGRPQIASGLRLTEIKRGRKYVHVREAWQAGGPPKGSWKKLNRAWFDKTFQLEDTNES